MNKTYLTIISVLIILILGVSAYALYKANNIPAAPAEITTPPAVPQPIPPPQPATKSAELQTTPFPLTIVSPANGAVVSTSSVVISGKTLPKADVSIGDNELAADVKGNFSATISLEEGENYIAIEAAGDDGNFAEQELLITYEPPQTP